MSYLALLYIGALTGLRWSLFADAHWRLRDHVGMAAGHAAVILAFAGLGCGDMHVLTFLGHALHYGPFFLLGHFGVTGLIQLGCQYRMKRGLALA